jgi:hypothetical protein
MVGRQLFLELDFKDKTILKTERGYMVKGLKGKKKSCFDYIYQLLTVALRA